MLPPQERREILIEVLTAMFSTIDDFRTFLQDDVGKRLDELAVGDLVTARSRVVDRAEEQEWLLELLEGMHKEAGPAAKEKLEQIGMLEDIRTARFHDDFYVAQYPLVNRKDLRARLRRLTTANGPRILHVMGSRYSGKSHALLHIRHVTTTLGIPLAEIELRKWATGEEIRPYDIGLAIASAAGLELPSHLDAKATRWAVNFLTWLGPQLASRRRLWIVFDDFEPEKLRVSLPQLLYDFIELLAEKVAGTPSLRLFLINYDKPLPNQVKPTLAIESVPAITEEDLGVFFFDFVTTYVPDTDLTAAEQESITRARRVYAKMGADPAVRLETMRDALLEECRELLPGDDE